MAEKEKTFEEKFQELESIVNHLEQGDVPLEKALDEFQKGIELSRELKKKLNEADELLAKIVDEDGNKSGFQIEDTSEENK